LPIDQINSVDDLLATPVGNPDLSVTPSTQPAAPVMRLEDIANIRPTTSLESVNHYTVQRVIDIAASVDGRDLGIVWMLAITGTTINVESLMGAIMSVDISVSNSILVVSFANDLRSREEIGPVRAMLRAGRIRLRPILMTALTMIIGMVPMALGMGQAGEQNAPLVRAVIGRS
jgi:multidrug efflux pump subunit AcrB